MLPQEMFALISRRRFIAEIQADTAQQALNVIEALRRGGITVFEISNQIPGFEELLRHYSMQNDVIVGAGSVISEDQAINATAAGARYISVPGVFPNVYAAGVEAGTPVMLSALTPTEIFTAIRIGSDTVRLFPASAFGGAQYIHDLLRKFSGLNLIISGGVSVDNLADYLALPVRALSLDTSLTPRALIEQGEWEQISRIARYFVEYANSWEQAGRPQKYIPQQNYQPVNYYPAQQEYIPQPQQMYPPAYQPAPQPNIPTQPQQMYPVAYQTGQQANIPAQSQPGKSQQQKSAQNVPQQFAQQDPNLSPEDQNNDDEFKPWDSRPVTNHGSLDEWIR